MKKREKSFFEHRGYVSYLTSLLLGDGFLRIYRRVWRALRPTLWLRRILRLFVWLVLLIESGVLFLMLSLALLLLVPSVQLLPKLYLNRQSNLQKVDSRFEQFLYQQKCLL